MSVLSHPARGALLRQCWETDTAATTTTTISFHWLGVDVSTEPCEEGVGGAILQIRKQCLRPHVTDHTHSNLNLHPGMSWLQSLCSLVPVHCCSSSANGLIQKCFPEFISHKGVRLWVIILTLWGCTVQQGSTDHCEYWANETWPLWLQHRIFICIYF